MALTAWEDGGRAVLQVEAVRRGLRRVVDGGLMPTTDDNSMFPHPRPSPATTVFVFAAAARAGEGGRWPFADATWSTARPPSSHAVLSPPPIRRGEFPHWDGFQAKARASFLNSIERDDA